MRTRQMMKAAGFCVPLCMGLLVVSNAVMAHHGGHHDTPAPPAPAPAPPPPAPLIMQAPVAAPNTQAVMFTNMMNSAVNNATANLSRLTSPSMRTLLPTDVTGIGGGLGRAEGLKREVLGDGNPGSQSFKELMRLIERDKRYDFTREWTAFTSETLADAGYINTQDESADKVHNENLQKGRVVHTTQVNNKAKKDKEPCFMPNGSAKITKIGPDELKLADGAVLVRAGTRPFYVSTDIGGQKIRTRIHGGVLAMLSVLDNRLAIANLTDLCCGACTAYIPAAESGKTHSVYVSIGQIAEIKPKEEKGSTSLAVASKQLSTNTLADGMTMTVYKYHFVSLLKRFNIAQALPAEDLGKVLKTQAAKASATGKW